MKTQSAILLQLTARDLQMFQKLNRAGWLTTMQIGTYFFPGKSLNAVSKRLRKLAIAGYLTGTQVSSTEMKYYRLAGRGHRVLLEQAETSDLIRPPSQLPRKLRHFTAVNDLRLAFDLGFPSAPLTLQYFYTEREYPFVGRHSNVPPHLLLQSLALSKLIPDAVAGLQMGGRDWDVALEYDAGTEPAHFFGRAKMQQYMECLANNSSMFEGCKILVIAPTLKRLLNLMRQTVLVHPPRGQFFFALLGKFQLPTWINMPIFLDAVDYFAVAWEGTTRVVVEKQFGQEALPTHTLQSLLTGTPANLSSRGERDHISKGRQQNNFPPQPRFHY